MKPSNATPMPEEIRVLEEIWPTNAENEAAFECLERMIHFMRKRQDPKIMIDKLRMHFGVVSNVFRADALVFQDMGMHHSDAMMLSRITELTRYINRTSYGEHPKLARLIDATPYLIANFYGLQEEHFYLFCLNHHGRLKARLLLSEGTEDGAIFDLRKVMLETLRADPAAIFISHNHPGGTLVPSPDDIDCTLSAIASLAEFEIPLVDHLIVAGQSVVSMRDNGFISEGRWMAQAPKNHLLRNWLRPYDPPKPKDSAKVRKKK